MRTDRKPSRSRKVQLSTGMALAVALFVSGNVAALGPTIITADFSIPSILTQINTYTQRIQMIAERAAEVQREIQRVRNLATQATSLVNGLSTVTMQNPTIRSLDHGMNRCEPDYSGGFSMSDLFSLLVPSLTSSVPEQQRAICKQIVTIKNQRHNENVKLLNALKNHVIELDRSTANFRSATTTGAQMSNLGQQTQILNKITVDIQYAQAITKVYDNTITSLEDDSKYLAEEALSGKKKGLGESLLATGAQTVALCGGLMVAKSDGSDFSCGL
jgi:hypothetical protein